ncbi:tyrosine recombinase [Bacteroidia bacterium]|nr:tyrosine recombinase [Bacteroidia bacterium]
MNVDLKVSFYIKRERKSKKSDISIYPVVGKIIIGKSIAQFSSKLKADERLWNVKSGRAIGKSHSAIMLNREINKINLNIHRHYSEILKRTGKVSALEVKNAFQGIASTQKTLLVLFDEIMQEFQLRIGIDRKQSSYLQYVNTRKHLKRFLSEKHNVKDIPLSQLNLPFIEDSDFYLRIKRKLKPVSVNSVIVQLLSAAGKALHKNLISHPPFFGYKLTRPEFSIRSLGSGEFERLISTPVESPSLNFVRDMFVFASFTGISYIDLKNLTWKEVITEEDGGLWISKSRQKTGIPFNVKLLDIPLRIIDRYKDFSKDDLVFNVYCQVKINKLLKEVAKLCGIIRPLSFHVARHNKILYRLLINKLRMYYFSIGNDLETSEPLHFTPFCTNTKTAFRLQTAKIIEY